MSFRPLLILSATLACGSFHLLADAPLQQRGGILYKRHCAMCHGETGRGDGPAANLNHPKPRDFSTGKFRLVSTDNGIPSRQDLFDTLTRGVPGTGMPPWGHLSEKDRYLLVDHVLALAREGLAEKLVRSALEEEEKMDFGEARKIASERLRPGNPIQMGQPGAAGPERIERGARLFRERCASCHGEGGRGMRDPTWKSAEGEGIASRDLSSDILKGGSDGDSLYRRIVAGIPGSPMPANGDLPSEKVWDIVHYIRSLREGAPQDAMLPSWTLPESANSQAREIDHDFHLTVLVTGAVGLFALSGLAASLLLAVKRKNGSPPYRPGSLRVEVTWVAIPTLIVLAMIANSWILYQQLIKPIPGAMRIRVTGRQFFWAFEYPESQVRSTGIVAVPAGKPIHFELESSDVIHSFFLPHLKMKRDAIPGLTTHLWLEGIDKPGLYPILCNQFCGTDHSIMNATLEVLPEEGFRQWISLRKEPREK